MLKEGIPLAKEETNWKAHIDAYFEACWMIEEDDEYETDYENDKEEEDESLNGMSEETEWPHIPTYCTDPTLAL